MSIYYKNKNGQTNKIAGHLTQRVNARWFLLERSIEDGQEYYTVPEDQTQQYFSTMMPFTIYSFGFSETNTTATPKIKYKNEVYDIADVTALQPGQLGIGQLKGVYQMFTQESDTDKTIYFIGNMHQDFDNIQSIIGKVIQLGVEGVIDEDRVVFTVQDADSYLPYRTDLREFFIAAHLPVVVPTFQSLDPTLKVAIEFGDTVYNLYNYMFGVDTPLTIGDLMSVATHDTKTGFFFSFKATFFENSDITGFAVIPPAINATQIEHIIEDSETIVTSLTPDKTKLSIHLAAATLARLNRTLVTPESNPPTTELVAIDTNGMQTMIKLGNEFTLEDGTLKANYSNATFVDYNKAQTLTEEQKLQARLNIGASAGSDVFDGQYENLTGKPILNTNNTATLPVNANETIDGTISLHKVSKTGKMADLQTDANHDFISTSEKSQIQTNTQNISDLDSSIINLESGKFDKTGGTISGDIIVTGTGTIQALSVGTLKLMSPNATEQQPYVVVTDDQGNTLKRPIGDLVGDIGGSVVTVGGVRQATYEMDNKADASALSAEVTARTNAISNLQSQITIHDSNISSLNEAINTEASTRENADNNLQTQINDISTHIETFAPHTARQDHAASGVQVGWYQVANLKTNGNYNIKIKQAYNYNFPQAMQLAISINNRLFTSEPFASITQISGVKPAEFSLSKIRVRQGTDEGTTYLDVYNPDQLWNTTWVDITSDTQNVEVETNTPFQFIGTEDNPSGYKISSLDLVTGFNTNIPLKSDTKKPIPKYSSMRTFSLNHRMWKPKTWKGLTNFNASYIWTDEDNIYYSNGSSQYILDKETSTWKETSWNGVTSFNGQYIWTDGDNIYLAVSSNIGYILDKETKTWNSIDMGKSISARSYIWTDGANLYYSYNYGQYIWDKSTQKWVSTTWNGYTPSGVDIWTDGDNIYCTHGSTSYVLNTKTNTWEEKTFTGLPWSIQNAQYIWTDGKDIYVDFSTTLHYKLDKSTSTWKEIKYNLGFNGNGVWTDGDNIYYSSGETQYVLDTLNCRCY